MQKMSYNASALSLKMSTLPPNSGEEETKNFLQTALVAAVCFLLVNLLIIFRLGPTSDEIWDLTGKYSGSYLAGGRFTVHLYRLIFSHSGVPVAYGIASSLYFGLAIATQIKILHIRDKWVQFLFIAFSVSVIQLSYFMICSYHADVICLGLFMVSCSYLLFEKAYAERSKTILCLSIIPAVIGLGAYQFIGMLLPTLFIIQLIQNLMHSSKQESITSVLRKAGIFIGWGLSVIASYFILSTISKSVCAPSDIELTEGYQATLILWGQLDIFTQILHIGKVWCLHLVGASYPGEWLYVTAFLPLTLLVHDIWKKNRPVSLRLFYTSLALSLYVIPFLPIAIVGKDLGARVYLSQPLACAAMWCIALSPHARRVKSWGILTLGIFIMLKASYVVSDMAFYHKRIYDQSVALRAEVLVRALQIDVPAGVNINSCPIITYKSLRSKLHSQDSYSSPITTFGFNSFEAYLGSSGINAARHSDPILSPIFKQMPVYPAPGSIKYHDGNILVKLGD